MVLILASSLLGSSINIPVSKVETTVPIVTVSFVKVFGMVYPVPTVEEGVTKTIIAVNLGGAAVPLIVSLYLMVNFPTIIMPTTIATIIVALLVHSMAKPVEGVGIATPLLAPPIIAALTAYLLSGGLHSSALAYIRNIRHPTGCRLNEPQGYSKTRCPYCKYRRCRNL